MTSPPLLAAETPWLIKGERRSPEKEVAGSVVKEFRWVTPADVQDPPTLGLEIARGETPSDMEKERYQAGGASTEGAHVENREVGPLCADILRLIHLIPSLLYFKRFED
jgi:hypothetical protein